MPALKDPLTLPCGHQLPNRIGKAAMSEQLGDVKTNAPTKQLIGLYGRWARSGAGTLITGNVMVDRTALGEPRNVVVDDERDIDLLREWAAASTQNGTQAFVQINHPGRQSPRMMTRRPVAPSAVPVSVGLKVGFAKPRALTEPEIEATIAGFARTAGIVVRAGFTGVQIHGAHGYLVSQFLSPLTNQRQDAWGGDPVRRRRFVLEIVRAVRAEIGAATPLAVKLNSADFQRGGFEEAESMEVVQALEAEGVDLLEISGGTYEKAAMVGVLDEQKESTRQREAYFLQYAETVREKTKMPLMLTGGFRTAAAMEQALENGAIDVIGLGRPMAVTPDVPRLLLEGRNVPPTRNLHTGVKAMDGLSDLTWHTHQLRRMGEGNEPDTNRSPRSVVASWARESLSDMIARGGPAR